MDVEIGQRYRHYSGKEYIVLGVGHHSESLERVVIYQGQYDDPTFGKNPIWVRPYDMFVETVEVDGVKKPRFLVLK